MTYSSWAAGAAAPLAAHLLELLGATFVRSTLLAAVCLLFAFLLRRRTAALRHLLWHGVLLTLLLLPLLSLVLPPLRRPALLVARDEPPNAFQSPKRRVSPAAAVVINAYDSRSDDQTDRRVILVLAALYFAGAAAVFFRLCVGLSRQRSLLANSPGIVDADLRQEVHELWLARGWRWKSRVCECADICVPVAVGVSEPVVLLPSQWRSWDKETREAVLIHEMAHVERGDATTLIFASLATCVYWFHPLSWILKRHLALLAEQSSDEEVLRHVDSERYAKILVDIARDLQHSGRRFFGSLPAAPMVQYSQFRLRLERILSAKPVVEAGSRFVRATLVACLVPLAYLSAAGHLERQVIEEDRGLDSLVAAAHSEGVTELEDQLQRDLTNQQVREKLLILYSQPLHMGDSAMQEKRDEQLLWLIANHPESEVLGRRDFGWPSYDPRASLELHEPSQPHYSEAESLWAGQLANRPESPEVLAHAAIFFQHKDAARALDLIKKARQLDPNKAGYVEYEASIYSAAELLATMPPGSFADGMRESSLTQSLREELATSSDAELLAAAGANLMAGARMRNSFSRSAGLSLRQPFSGAELAARGKQLMDRATALDPENLFVKRVMENMNRPRSQPPPFGPPGAVRIGPRVMDSSLLHKADVVYPPLAKQARIQGNVVFNVAVDTDGSVSDIGLWSGHPLLVNAAKEAVAQYRYRPTLLNGNPVPVITTVTVEFRLPAASN